MSSLLKNDQHDLRAYLAAAHNLRAGRDIYARYVKIPEDPTLTRPIPQYLYPPLLAILFVPLSFLPFSKVRYIWQAICAALIIHTVILVAPGATCAALVLLILLLGSPFWWHQRCGQVDIFIFWLVAVGYTLFADGEYLMAGLIIACACWCKITPGLVALYLMTFSAQFALSFVLFGLMFLIIQLPIRGMWRYFVHILPFHAKFRYPLPYAQSLSALIPRKCAYNALKILLLCGVFFVRDPFVGVALCCICMMLVPNIGWNMAFVGAVIPFVVLYQLFFSSQLCISVMVLSIPLFYISDDKKGGPGLSMFLAYIILWYYAIFT